MTDVFFYGYGSWKAYQQPKDLVVPPMWISKNIIHYRIEDLYRAVFRLKDEDTLRFRHTGNLDSIHELLPSNHPNGSQEHDNLAGAFFSISRTIEIVVIPANEDCEADKNPDKSEKQQPEYLDNSHPMYSEELAIAINTWMAVLSNNPDRPKQGSRKKIINDYVSKNHRLSAAALDRIVTMLNPDKKGGVTKTE